MSKKKIIIGSVLIFTLALQVGCSEKASEENLNNSEPIKLEAKENEVIDQNDNKQNEIMDEFNSLVKKDMGLNETIKFIDKNISLLSKENASIMIDKLEEAQKENLQKLEEKFYADGTVQFKMNKIYKPEFDINKIDNVKDNELKDLLTETRDSGYKIQTAEGSYFPIINYEFYRKYSSYVTSDIKDYIDIMAVESNKSPAKDAALVIGWDEVLKRALNQEQFINQYSDSVKIYDVKQLYKEYVSYILFGLNNTPLFNYDSKIIVDDAKSIYMKTIEDNTDSKLVDTLRGYFDVLKNSNYKLTDEIDEYRKNALENIL